MTSGLGRWTGVLAAAWLGASLLASAVVAPAAFSVLPTSSLAGDLVGRVLPPVFWSGVLVALATAWFSWRGGNRLERFVPILWAVALLVAQVAIAPKIEAMRRSLGSSPSSLDSSDSQRQAFAALHGASVGLLGMGMIAALTIVILCGRQQRRLWIADHPTRPST